MRMVVCAVRDAKVQAFTPPFFVRTKGEAMRSFSDACVDSSLALSKHPEDYQLFLLATWDDANGAFESVAPELLISGSDAVSMRTAS